MANDGREQYKQELNHAMKNNLTDGCGTIEERIDRFEEVRRHNGSM